MGKEKDLKELREFMASFRHDLAHPAEFFVLNSWINYLENRGFDVLEERETFKSLKKANFFYQKRKENYMKEFGDSFKIYYVMNVWKKDSKGFEDFLYETKSSLDFRFN